jgi:hypothetical protein
LISLPQSDQNDEEAETVLEDEEFSMDVDFQPNISTMLGGIEA